jgi:hypothetical protein
MKIPFKFDLGTNVSYCEKSFIIVGRAQYLSISSVYYMVEEETHYTNNGLDFSYCSWISETDLEKKIENEKNKENKE